MLERSTAPEKLRQLQDHYENLLVAYGAIKKAEEQLVLLRPLVADARKYEQVQGQAAELEGCKAAFPFYFRKQKLHLYETALTLAQQDWEQAKIQQKQVKSSLEARRQQSIALNVAIGNDELGQRSRELEQELKFARENFQRKKDRADQYDQLVHEFKLSSSLDESTFHQSWHKAQSFRTVIEQQLSKLEKELSDLRLEEKKIGEEHDEAQRELHSLRARTSQIPSQNLQLRQLILNALGIDEVDIPFVGELLKVKESERSWEGAIERLLHNFGLSLLVPERHYHRFNLYVNQTNLQARIVFRRVRDGQSYRPNPHIDGAAVLHKVEIKPQSDYYEWIENELQERFNYICCEEMSHFERVTRAITKNGLIKGGHERHEKDDRRRIDDRRYYILGWDNLSKIRLIEAMVEKLGQQLRTKETEIRQIREKRELAYKKRDKLETLLRFSDFAEIDWRTDETHIQDLQAQQTRLEQSSNHLQQLRQELKETEQKIAEDERAYEKASAIAGQLQYQVQAYEKEIAQCQSYLRETDEAALRLHAPRIQAQVSQDLTLSTIERVEGEVREYFDKEISKARERISDRRRKLELAMQKYKDLYPVETNEFDVGVEAIPEFDRELARIDRDDLPQYKERFKLLLDEKIIEAIAYLQAELDDYVEDLKESIDNLNQSLRKINYTPDTYIELKTERTRDQEIRAFQQALRECLPDVGQPKTEQTYENSFQKIKELITRFKEDQRWTNKVIDVRYWLNFAAVERYRADDVEKHYYSDSSGKSGGQKAKLAYTILASAIAFQFGLEDIETHPKSFRFVVVDEAFSRSDENNSRYAMQLFKELGLQLLVVTPLVGTHIVEPFISTCHFVWNNAEGNNSQVTSMSVDDFRAQRLG